MPNAAASSSSQWTTVDKPGSCESDNDIQSWTIQNEDTQEKRSFLVYVPPSICTSDQTDADNIIRYPILLAFHGYTGKPRMEIKKWKDVSEEQKLIVVAPKGTSSSDEDSHLGWNAIDCCGYPVTSKVDDIGFSHAVIETLRDEMFLADASNVVAAGFSNGGFFVSLLGLQQQRPPWLKGIVPTGGYQYDASLYNGKLVDTLPVFAHHGGSDSVVRPGGCCRQPDRNSNCPTDIGAKRDTCLSTENAFDLWANNINVCQHTETQTTDEGAICSTGIQCRNDAVTKLCMWPNAGHSWGDNMPGRSMVGEFIADVFTAKPSKSGLRGTEHGTSRIIAAMAVTLIFASLFLARSRFRKLNVSSLFFHKRKKSNDIAIDDVEEEITELVSSIN
mmetsp:Transcript_18065/g.32753  ORF Transcript_18065/g.32753 Transcript_18065/m.32753 type:complete len:389 (-) Transcript_18065:134-1300(-)